MRSCYLFLLSLLRVLLFCAGEKIFTQDSSGKDLFRKEESWKVAASARVVKDLKDCHPD